MKIQAFNPVAQIKYRLYEKQEHCTNHCPENGTLGAASAESRRGEGLAKMKLAAGNTEVVSSSHNFVRKNI
jgi:hypothetical protein